VNTKIMKKGGNVKTFLVFKSNVSTVQCKVGTICYGKN